MKTSSALRYSTQRGSLFQYLHLQHWQNQTQSSAIEAGVLSLHCLGWGREIRGLWTQAGLHITCWAAIPQTLLSITQSYVQPTPEQNAGMSCSAWAGHGWLLNLRTGMVTERGFRHTAHLRVSPHLPVVLPVSQLRKSLPLVNSPRCLWQHGLHPGARLSSSQEDMVLWHHWGSVSANIPILPAPPCLLLVPWSCNSLWLLHEADWELIWFKSGNERPPLF